MADDKNKRKKQSYLKWFDYIAIPIGVFFIIFFFLFSAELLFVSYANKLSSLLFNILSLLFVGYISTRVAYLISKSEFLANQKKLAKTSIRHLRENIGELISVQMLVKKRINSIEEDGILSHYLEEIENLIKNIAKRIKLSENDFKEIVNEEFKEENTIIENITPIWEDIKIKQSQLEGLQEQKGKEADRKIEKLSREIQENKIEIEKNLNRLPFGSGIGKAGFQYTPEDLVPNLFSVNIPFEDKIRSFKEASTTEENKKSI